MTQQEQQLLSGLVERVNGTKLESKDAEAEQLLAGAFRNNPDALYILCQTVLVQQFAMDNAQRQLTEARAEIDRLKQSKPEEHGSFLGNLFGLGKTDSDTRQQAPQAPGGGTAMSSQGGYQPVHNPGTPVQYVYPPQPVSTGYGYGQQGYGAAPPVSGTPMGGSMFGGGGGFLQGAMQTAAGVVAGEFAFRALEDVFHGFGGGGGRGFEGGTEVVNNYYGDDGGSRDSGGFGDRLRDADGLGDNISPDIEDRRGDSRGFFGGGDSGGGDASGFTGDGSDTSGFSSGDDGSFSGSDDFGGSGFDDGGDNSNDNGF